MRKTMALALSEAIATEDRGEEIIIYLREVDGGTDNACWVVCSKGDPGALAFIPQ